MTRKKGEKRETGKKKNSLVCERRRMVYQTKKKERERERMLERDPYQIYVKFCVQLNL